MRFPLLSFVLCLLPILTAADIKVVEEIVAKVNGDIITRSEIERSRLGLRAEAEQRGLKDKQLADVITAKEGEVLRDRIDQLLLIQKGKELNINVDSEISKQVAEIQREAAKTDPALADPEKFQAYVKEQTGMPFEDYKAEMKNGMLTQRVIQQEVGSKINIPKAELQKYYEEHKPEFIREDRIFLSEILLSTAGKDAAGKAAAEKKSKDLVARAKKGERFGDLARDNSDADSAKNYGDIGAHKCEDLRKEISQAVCDKQRSFLTDPPLAMENGFLILKVEERHKAGQAGFEEVSNAIMERLYMPVFQPKIREYLTKLRQDAFLEIKDGYLDASAAPGKNTRWTDPAQLKPETVTKDEVANRSRRKRLLWAVPIPGTTAQPRSSSKK